MPTGDFPGEGGHVRVGRGRGCCGGWDETLPRGGRWAGAFRAGRRERERPRGCGHLGDRFADAETGRVQRARAGKRARLGLGLGLGWWCGGGGRSRRGGLMPARGLGGPLAAVGVPPGDGVGNAPGTRRRWRCGDEKGEAGGPVRVGGGLGCGPVVRRP
ncbi:hypothetical protein GCM10010359_05000 [Streptomyces morookaense]|nr:hypothetical protein GCM10010359_05000 [Streptomyces morookaense]